MKQFRRHHNLQWSCSPSPRKPAQSSRQRSWLSCEIRSTKLHHCSVHRTNVIHNSDQIQRVGQHVLAFTRKAEIKSSPILTECMNILPSESHGPVPFPSFTLSWCSHEAPKAPSLSLTERTLYHHLNQKLWAITSGLLK